MRHRLILTLTTTRGSVQMNLGKLGKYLFFILVLVALTSLVVSNWLLVRTAGDLTSLERDHTRLANLYSDVLSRNAHVRTELDSLNELLARADQERKRLIDSRSQVEQELEQTLSERNRWASTLNELERRLGLEETVPMTLERAQALQQIVAERLFLLHGIPNGSPVPGIPFTDSFGWRKHPVTGKRKHHNGLDFLANTGEPVHATADGAVEYAGFHKESGFGNLVIINHNFGFKTYYAHMKKAAVKSGQIVQKGELVGYSGNSGVSTGPHLHYEVRYLYKPLNPLPFVRWSMENYDSLFSEVREIPWDSLRKMHPLSQVAAPLL